MQNLCHEVFAIHVIVMRGETPPVSSGNRKVAAHITKPQKGQRPDTFPTPTPPPAPHDDQLKSGPPRATTSNPTGSKVIKCARNPHSSSSSCRAEKPDEDQAHSYDYNSDMKRRIVRILVVLVVVGSVGVPVTNWWRSLAIETPQVTVGSADGVLFAVWNRSWIPFDAPTWRVSTSLGYEDKAPLIPSLWSFYFHPPTLDRDSCSLPWWLINLILWPAAAGVWWWTGRWRSGAKRGFPMEATGKKNKI